MQKNPNPRGAKETKKPGTKGGTVIQTKKNARGAERSTSELDREKWKTETENQDQAVRPHEESVQEGGPRIRGEGTRNGTAGEIQKTTHYIYIYI